MRAGACSRAYVFARRACDRGSRGAETTAAAAAMHRRGASAAVRALSLQRARAPVATRAGAAAADGAQTADTGREGGAASGGAGARFQGSQWSQQQQQQYQQQQRQQQQQYQQQQRQQQQQQYQQYQQQQKQRLQQQQQQQRQPLPPQPKVRGAPVAEVSSLLPKDIEELSQQVAEVGAAWVDALAEADLLEEAKKMKLATISLHHMEGGDSKAAAEVKALASEEYSAHVEKMVRARQEANRAKVQYEALKAHLNLVRTYEASRRAEMQLL